MANQLPATTVENSDRERAYMQIVKDLADNRTALQLQIAGLRCALDEAARRGEEQAAAFSDVIVAQALRRIKSSAECVGVLVPETYTHAWPATFQEQIVIKHNCVVTMNFTSTNDSYSHKYDDWEFDDDDDDDEDNDAASHVIVRDGTDDDDDANEKRYKWRDIFMPWEFWENAGQFWMQTWPGDCRVEEENYHRRPVNRLTINTRRLVLIRGAAPPKPPAIVENERA